MRLKIKENLLETLEGYLEVQKRLQGISTTYQERFTIRVFMEDLLRNGTSMSRLAHDLLTYTQAHPTTSKNCHNFLKCFLFHLCWKYKYSETNILVKILAAFWRFSHSFHQLFDNLHIIPFLQQDRRQEFMAKLEYFLDHGASLEVPTAEGYVRMIDAYMSGEETPLALACRFRQPGVVLLLLRYGARTELPYARHEFGDCLEVLMTSLYFVNTTENDSKDVEKCLKYFCRVVDRINVTRLENRLADNMYKPSHPAWRDKISSRRHKDPAELQHLCRTTIRKEMNISAKLPKGIEELPLPRRMKMYLDLRLD